jgi:hypothetical protein
VHLPVIPATRHPAWQYGLTVQRIPHDGEPGCE